MTRDHIAAERNFLGCLLRSPHEFWNVNDVVAPDHFTLGHHRDVYSAIRDIAEGGRVVSTTALLAHLPEEYEDVGPTIGVLATLKENAIEAGSATDYAPFIAEQAATKRIDQLAQWLQKEIRTKLKSAEDIASEAAIRLQEIMKVSSPLRPKRLGDVVSIIARQNNESDDHVAMGVTSGITPLDEIIGTVLGGDLGCILASQGDGKSALAAQIGVHAARSGRPVLYVQLEMSDEQMAARELAAESGLTVAQIHERAFDAFEWEKIAGAERELARPEFFILDADEISIRQIKSQCIHMQKSGGLGLVIIDQLDKLKAEGKYRDRFERFAELTRDLKKLAKSLRVPVIVLAQRTRGAQRRDDPKPSILDADAVSIERDCDWVLALWQKANHMRMNPPDDRSGTETRANWETKVWQAQGIAQVMMLKHRRRKAHEDRTLKFHGPTMRFHEL